MHNKILTNWSCSLLLFLVRCVRILLFKQTSDAMNLNTTTKTYDTEFGCKQKYYITA